MNETRIPLAIRNWMEKAFEANLSDITIRIGSELLAFNAHAMTSGTTITFAPDAYDLSSASGLQLLAHELTHVIQQRQGRLSYSSESILLNEQALEDEANFAAYCLLNGYPLPSTVRGPHTLLPTSNGIQFQRWGWVGQNVLTAGDTRDIGVGMQFNEDAMQYPPPDNYPGSVIWKAEKNGMLICFKSTTTVNEVYRTRAEAWTRAISLAHDIMGYNPIIHLNSIYMLENGQHMTTAQVSMLAAQRAAAQSTHNVALYWVRHNIRDAIASYGYYYDFGRVGVGFGNLLIVEHIADSDAMISYKNSAQSPWKSLNSVKHFHVAAYNYPMKTYIDDKTHQFPVYRPEMSKYIAINPYGDQLTIRGQRDAHILDSTPAKDIVTETNTIESRIEYQYHQLPNHHIYYLA